MVQQACPRSPASWGTLPRCCKHVWYQAGAPAPAATEAARRCLPPTGPPAPSALPQLLARQRIPSGQYADPLGHIFDEFDKDRRWVLAEGGGWVPERCCRFESVVVGTRLEGCGQSIPPCCAGSLPSA